MIEFDTHRARNISPEMIQDAAGTAIAKDQVLHWFGWAEAANPQKDILTDEIDENDCRFALFFDEITQRIGIIQPFGPPIRAIIDLKNGTVTWYEHELVQANPERLDLQVYTMLDILCRSYTNS